MEKVVKKLLAGAGYALQPRRPPALRNTIKALVEGNPPEDLPEHLFPAAMRTHGLVRRESAAWKPVTFPRHSAAITI